MSELTEVQNVRYVPISYPTPQNYPPTPHPPCPYPPKTKRVRPQEPDSTLPNKGLTAAFAGRQKCLRSIQRPFPAPRIMRSHEFLSLAMGVRMLPPRILND